jgi:predicted acylesterase/phospholipase RssA
MPIKINNNYYVDGCITNNLPYNVFENINHDDILCVAIHVKDDYLVTDLFESTDDINFLMYYKQVSSIIYYNSVLSTYIKRVEGFKNPLIISKSHFKTFYNFKITDNSIEFNINENDIQNLILQGFTDITEYMKTFEINDDNDNENDNKNNNKNDN